MSSREIENHFKAFIVGHTEECQDRDDPLLRRAGKLAINPPLRRKDLPLPVAVTRKIKLIDTVYVYVGAEVPEDWPEGEPPELLEHTVAFCAGDDPQVTLVRNSKCEFDALNGDWSVDARLNTDPIGTVLARLELLEAESQLVVAALGSDALAFA